MFHGKDVFSVGNRWSFFARGGGVEGEARLSSVLCMGIGSTVERSLVALAQCFSLFAHPCYCVCSGIARIMLATILFIACANIN